VPGEPLDQLIDTVDPGACHLINLPSLIWVLGGPFTPDSGKTSTSLRDSFWRQTLSTSKQLPWLEQLDCPENHNGWWAFSGYGDLLQFERDACYLARATILFAESPGSLAELGALALDESILPRLLVIVQSQYLQEETRESFLNLGPLKRVQERGFRCVIGASSNQSLPVEDFETITESINSWLPKTHHSLALRASNPTHRLLLLADLVDLLLVSKKNDLLRAATHFGVKMDESELLRALNLLDFFGFVKLETQGNEPFWVRRRTSRAPWVDYTAKAEGRFDRIRFKVTCEECIQKDPRRQSIFARPQ